MLANAEVRLYWLCLAVAALLLTGVLRAQEQLPIGFFDYLGGMVEQDGELLDPLMLEDAERQAAAQPVAFRPDVDPDVDPDVEPAVDPEVEPAVGPEKVRAQSSTDQDQEAQ